MFLKIESSEITSFFYNTFFPVRGGFEPPLTPPPPAYATAIFTSIINATNNENQIKDDQQVFAIAFGLDMNKFQICDLIALLEYLKKMKEESNSNAAGD